MTQRNFNIGLGFAILPAFALTLAMADRQPGSEEWRHLESWRTFSIAFAGMLAALLLQGRFHLLRRWEPVAVRCHELARLLVVAANDAHRVPGGTLNVDYVEATWKSILDEIHSTLGGGIPLASAIVDGVYSMRKSAEAGLIDGHAGCDQLLGLSQRMRELAYHLTR